MAKKSLPTPEQLRQALRYDPASGRLYWKSRPTSAFRCPKRAAGWNTRFADKEAGTVSTTTGYKMISFGKGRGLLAHRVAFAIYHGHWPEVVDHIDGDRTNNKIENLRSVTHKYNHRNRKRATTNTSGHTGITWCTTRECWYVAIGVDGKNKYLGRTKTLEEAIQKRKAAEVQYGFTDRHGR